MRALIVAASLVLAGPAFVAASEPETSAEQPAADSEIKAVRLDGLFAELQAAQTPTQGKIIERRILIEWLRSGDKAVDTMMTAAVVAMDMRAFRPAIELLDKVVAEKPDYVEGWNKRATVYYYMGLYDRSLADIEKTLAIEPRHFGALAGLGMIMQDVGNVPGAIAAFERAVAVNPSLENIKAAIGQLKARIGRDI